MISTVEFDGELYPQFQAEGNGSQFAIPFAKKVCVGEGYDIGYSRVDWKLPGAIGIDLKDSTPYDAMNLPEYEVDYIYSSHTLEHLVDWVKALEYWSTKIKRGGVLFLYLPHRDQKYWHPWNDRRHLHLLDAESIEECLIKFGFSNIFYSERDLNHSFIIMAQKK